jgi:hypothetical protein
MNSFLVLVRDVPVASFVFIAALTVIALVVDTTTITLTLSVAITQHCSVSLP